MNQGKELELCAVAWEVSPEMHLQGSEDGDMGQRKLQLRRELILRGVQDLVWSLRVTPKGIDVTDFCVSTSESHWQGKG